MMARSRNIKPGFFQNEDLADLDFATRLLFIGLWTEADREGRLEDRPKRLKIALFPADEVDMEPMLAALQGKGFISRYQAEGKQIIQIVKWAKHQNPHKREGASVLPAQDGCRAPVDEPEAEEADSGPEKPDIEGLFESFWKVYPRKTAKDTARKSFAKLSPTPDLMKQIMEAVAVHRTSAAWLKDDGQFIPHAATWLNQKRWNDEVRPSNVHQLRSRHHGFDERDYSEGLFEREDGTYGF